MPNLKASALPNPSFHKQEIRDIIETTATLPPRLLNAES
jgi:hypothetical protein